MSLSNLSLLTRRVLAKGNTRLLYDEIMTPKLLLSKREVCNLPVYSSLSRSEKSINGVHFDLTFKRFKKTFSRKIADLDKQNEDKEEEEEDDEDEVEENPLLVDDLLGGEQVDDSGQVFTIDVNSLRLDAVGKTAFSVTRAKIEEAFYKGELYVNGEKAVKKSQDLYEGDEIDLIKQVNLENPSKLDIKRMQILKLPDKTTEQGRIKISIKRWQELTIDAYENYREK